jgi:GNAT superfamily N-acetyltransferase
VRQWQPGELPRAVVARRIAAGETFVAPDGGGGIRATVTLDFADASTWGERGDDGTAGYVHTLVVDPAAAGDGIGRQIMPWAEVRIAARGRVGRGTRLRTGHRARIAIQPRRDQT